MAKIIKFPDKKVPGHQKTIRDVVETMSEEQKEVLYFLVGAAIEDTEEKYRRK